MQLSRQQQCGHRLAAQVGSARRGAGSRRAVIARGKGFGGGSAGKKAKKARPDRVREVCCASQDCLCLFLSVVLPDRLRTVCLSGPAALPHRSTATCWLVRHVLAVLGYSQSQSQSWRMQQGQEGTAGPRARGLLRREIVGKRPDKLIFSLAAHGQTSEHCSVVVCPAGVVLGH